MREAETHVLEQLVLKRHVRLRLQAHTGAEDVRQRSTLLGKCIDNGRTRWRERSLEHVGKDAEDAVEALELIVGALGAARVRLPLNTRHDLGHEDEVDNERRGKQRVFTNVKEARFQIRQ